MFALERLHTSFEQTDAVSPAVSRHTTVCEIVNLLSVPEAPWLELFNRAAEPNIFFHPRWARAVSRHAEGKGGAKALLVWAEPSRKKLIALLPVVSATRALGLPLPVLVAWQAYAPLTTPLIDRDLIEEGARGLVAASGQAGAVSLMFPLLATEGPIMKALNRTIAKFGTEARLLNVHRRARFDATQDARTAFDLLGNKKLKELRRQRNRLADVGEIKFDCTTHSGDITSALETFLLLEASGWKGRRGTALNAKPGDTAFIREAVAGLAASGCAEVVTISCGASPLAAGLVLRHLNRAYFYKTAYEESVSKMSPGVQLTIDISRKLCVDRAVDDIDSTAVADHPMIDHIWQGRLTVADVILPLQPRTATFQAVAALIVTRHAVHETARRIVHFVRRKKGKRS